MPYKSVSSLPARVKKAVPEKYRSMWRKVFNSVLKRGGSEATAFKQAYGTVRNAKKKS